MSNPTADRASHHGVLSLNFQPLFTTARVVTAIYRIASTTLLLMYLARRVSSRRPPARYSDSSKINRY